MKRLKETLLVATVLAAASALGLAQGDYNKGLSYYKQGNYAKAIAEFEPIVKDNPEYEDGFRILGHSYLQTRQFEKAAQAFRKAIDLKEGNISSYLGLGISLYNQNRYQDSIAALLEGERYAQATRDKLQIYQMRGSAYFNLGNWPKAIENLERAQTMQRGNASTLLQLGISHFKQGSLSAASNFLEQVLALDPSNQQAQRFQKEVNFRYAAQAISKKDSATAISLLKKISAADPQDADAWFNLGLAQLLAEDLEAAEGAFRKSSAIQPDKAETFDRLGYIYEVTSRYQKALEAYGKAHQLSGSAESKASVDRIQERIRRQNSGSGAGA